MESGIQLMFDLSAVATSPEQIVGASERPVKTSQSQDSAKDLGGDRSSLIREVFRVLGECKEEDRPEWLIYENVKGMLSSNRGFDFLAILLELDELGYDCEWEIFNTKNFGVPQNRERVYTVGHLRSRGRKQIFPLKGADGENSFCEVNQIGMQASHRTNPNQYRLYDTQGLSPCLNRMDGGGREPHIPVQFGIDYNVQGEESKIANCLKARYDAGVSNYKKDRTAVAIPVLTPDRTEKRQNGRRFKENGDEAFTLTAQDRHGVALEVKEATKQGYAIAHEGDSINLSMLESKTRRGRVGKGVANTLDCKCEQGVFVKLSEDVTVYAVWYEKYNCYIAIRKLTPLECWRLQAFSDEEFQKAQFVNSDSQLYKQAGNSVTVAVVYEIAERIKESDIK